MLYTIHLYYHLVVDPILQDLIEILYAVYYTLVLSPLILKQISYPVPLSYLRHQTLASVAKSTPSPVMSYAFFTISND